MSAVPAFEISNLRAGYGPVTVLHGVDLTVAKGKITALIGGNGAGKTTLMRAISGVLPVSDGIIRHEGTDITRASAHERVDAGISMVPEGRLIFPSMTVAENLKLGAISPRARSGADGRIDEIYRRFPRLKERSGQFAATLSGGEQQMLALGRGLMARPQVLLLDEPTLGLAPVMVKELFATIEQLRREELTILIAEQNVQKTLDLADSAYVIEHGRLVLSGTGAELAADPAVRRAYLGI